MAESHFHASGAGGAHAADAGMLAGPDREEDALGFECADPRLQIESWAELAGGRAGNAESASRSS